MPAAPLFGATLPASPQTQPPYPASPSVWWCRSLRALMGGLVKVSLEVSAVLPHVRADNLKTLLILDERPSPDLRNSPTNTR